MPTLGLMCSRRALTYVSTRSSLSSNLVGAWHSMPIVGQIFSISEIKSCARPWSRRVYNTTHVLNGMAVITFSFLNALLQSAFGPAGTLLLSLNKISSWGNCRPSNCEKKLTVLIIFGENFFKFCIRLFFTT